MRSNWSDSDVPATSGLARKEAEKKESKESNQINVSRKKNEITDQTKGHRLIPGKVQGLPTHLPFTISANIHPMLQISTGVLYLRLPMRTSGARYHSVTTS